MESVNHLFVRSLFGNNFHFLFVVWKQKNPNKIILIAFFFVICFEGPIRNSDGYYILDDMLLDENQIKLFDGTDRSGATNAIRWPNGVIPYKFSSKIQPRYRKAIKGSLHIFNEEFRGCLKTRYNFSFYLALPFRDNEMIRL